MILSYLFYFTKIKHSNWEFKKNIVRTGISKNTGLILFKCLKGVLDHSRQYEEKKSNMTKIMVSKFTILVVASKEGTNHQYSQ